MPGCGQARIGRCSLRIRATTVDPTQWCPVFEVHADDRPPQPNAEPRARSRSTLGVSIVIPCHDQLELTLGCLESIDRHGATSHVGEVLVVDNGSAADFGVAIDAWAGQSSFELRRIRLETNLGFAAGVNKGLAEASERLVLILNNDTLLAPECLERLVASWLRTPRVGLVAPLSNYVRGRQRVELEDGEGPETLERMAQRLARNGPIQEDVENLAGLCLLTETSLLRELGGFDEAYGIGNYEDDDLCLRMRQRGLRLVIARDAYLHHFGNATFSALGVDYRRQLEEQRTIFDAKWKGDALAHADELLEHGRWAELEELARAELDGGSALPWMHFALARALEIRGELDGALEHWHAFERAIPEHAVANAHHALCEIAVADEAIGRVRLERAIEHFGYDPPALASIWTQLARHEIGRDREADALIALEDAFAACPDFVPAHYLRARLDYEAGRFDAVRDRLSVLDDGSCEDSDVLNLLALAHRWLGDGRRCLDALSRAADIGGRESVAGQNLLALARELEVCAGS